jgi:hypothetical protein
MTQCGEGVCVSPGEPPDGPPPADRKDNEKTKTKVKVRVSLFYDGTANNRKNTWNRLQNNDIYKKYGEDDNSYGNDYSNVSRLQEYVQEGCPGYDYHVSVYVDGIGTIDDKADETIRGQGLGMFSTGVKGKTDKGIRMALSSLLEVLPANVDINRLSLDTFGFSRGAAAARYCVHRALHDEDGGLFGSDWHGLPTLLEAAGHSVDSYDVIAVGLWDTVSSYGLNHTNDVAQLKLNAISCAKAVLHLAAANEYRVNFSLTTIDSAGGRGRQFYLPGAHADVGGCYVHLDFETKVIIEGAPAPHIARFLLEGGWYLKEELTYTQQLIKQGHHPHVDRSVSVSRYLISQEYSYIPLGIMARFAEEHELNVNHAMYKQYKPKFVPEEIRNRIDAYVAAEAASVPEDWADNDPVTQKFRHDYLHVSSSTDFGFWMRVQHNEDGSIEPHREVIRG